MPQEPVKFKLLDLPSVAIQHVIRRMDLKTMFFFSLASRKAKSILNYSLPRNYFHVSYSFWINKCIILNDKLVIRTNVDISEENARPYMIQGVLYKIFKFNNQIQINWDESFQAGMETLMTHFAESFHLPKTSYKVRYGIDSEATFVFLNHAKNLTCPLMEVQSLVRYLPIEVYKAFLGVGPRIIQKLHLESRSAPDFQFRPSEVFKLDELEIGDGRWVHLEDFMECKHVVVGNMTRDIDMYCAESKNLNDFFKLWKASSCRLEFLKVEVRCTERNFEKITAELNGTNYLRIDNAQSVEIHRVDGKKAKIRMTRMYLTLKVFD